MAVVLRGAQHREADAGEAGAMRGGVKTRIERSAGITAISGYDGRRNEEKRRPRMIDTVHPRGRFFLQPR